MLVKTDMFKDSIIITTSATSHSYEKDHKAQ